MQSSSQFLRPLDCRKRAAVIHTTRWKPSWRPLSLPVTRCVSSQRAFLLWYWKRAAGLYPPAT
jgi:hypothetical protein